MLAPFEARLTAIERRIIEFPLEARPKSSNDRAFGSSRCAISLIGSSIAPNRMRSRRLRSATRRAGRRSNKRRRQADACCADIKAA